MIAISTNSFSRAIMHCNHNSKGRFYGNGRKKELKSPDELVEILKGKGVTFSHSMDERAAINSLRKTITIINLLRIVKISQKTKMGDI